MVADGEGKEPNSLLPIHSAASFRERLSACFGTITSAEGEIAKDDLGQETNLPGMR